VGGLAFSPARDGRCDARRLQQLTRSKQPFLGPRYFRGTLASRARGWLGQAGRVGSPSTSVSSATVTTCLPPTGCVSVKFPHQRHQVPGSGEGSFPVTPARTLITRRFNSSAMREKCHKKSIKVFSGK
jgi:hypothetical protein